MTDILDQEETVFMFVFSMIVVFLKFDKLSSQASICTNLSSSLSQAILTCFPNSILLSKFVSGTSSIIASISLWCCIKIFRCFFCSLSTISSRMTWTYLESCKNKVLQHSKTYCNLCASVKFLISVSIVFRRMDSSFLVDKSNLYGDCVK